MTAFLSVAPKVATLGFLLRVFYDHQVLRLTPVLAIFAAITMTVGNLGALKQINIKRLMGYSSIAQIGYLLTAFVAGGGLNGQGSQSLLIYAFVYAFMNLGLFSVLLMLSQTGKNDDLTVFRGLAHRSLPLALAMVVFLLALTGIPPVSGFVGKFLILAAVLKTQGLLWLGILLVINSVISLYYYFGIAREMFFKEVEGGTETIQWRPGLLASVSVSLVLTLFLGVAPSVLIIWVRQLLGS